MWMAMANLRIWTNEEGRELLVQELHGLNKGNQHFYLGPDEFAHIQISTRPYRSDDKIFEYGEVLSDPMNGTSNTCA
jgi:hypothetical protein